MLQREFGIHPLSKRQGKGLDTSVNNVFNVKGCLIGWITMDCQIAKPQTSHHNLSFDARKIDSIIVFSKNMYSHDAKAAGS